LSCLRKKHKQRGLFLCDQGLRLSVREIKDIFERQKVNG
jgi:hypothetical protein